MARKSDSKDSEKPRRPRRRFWPLALKWAAVLGLWTAVAVTAIVAWYAYTLPDISGINKFARRPALTFVAADGQVITTYGDLFGGPVELKDMSPWLPRAVLATEDRRFYDHFGLDLIGLARATVVNLRAGRIVQGGSTITQQLAKNVFLTGERSFRRKIQELLLAFWLEREFTKDQILTIYLNRVYLGSGTYGVEAAAQRYFDKSARRLSAHEAAVIAGLLKAPSRYSPAARLQRAKARAGEVLANLVEAGYMSEAESAAAAREPLKIAATTQAGRGARYFTDWLADAVPGFVGFIDRDLTIVTTLDARLQLAAEAEVAKALARDGGRANISQAALVAMSPDGAVRAMIGGRDYAESQFNRATDAQRQPGSAFKPFVFLAAVEAGMRPDDRIGDGPVTIGDWSPRNFDNTFKGNISLREALARSVNTATVRVAQRAGIDKVIAAANRLGIGATLRRDFATALGASEVSLFELTAAFAPFANGGNGVLPYAIQEIRDSTGQVLYRRVGSGPGPVIDRPALAAMTDMMQAVMIDGTGRAAAFNRPAAGKTGTSQEHRDAWFVGFTSDFVVGVWCGNDDGDPMERVTGGSLPARVWRGFMQEAHKGHAPRQLPGASVGVFEEILNSVLRGVRNPVPAAAPAPPTTHDPMVRPGVPRGRDE